MEDVSVVALHLVELLNSVEVEGPSAELLERASFEILSYSTRSAKGE